MRARETGLRRPRLAGLALCAALFCPQGMALDLQTALPGPLQLAQALGSAGSSAAAALALAAPVPGARISSPFGWRIHPILKVPRFHNGVDYAAPLGTPVHAAAGGVVEQIGRRKDFGLFLRIRHAGEVETGYSHLARLAPGIRVGRPIGVGEIIGKVGRSGRATGPHLDFELIVAGRTVDPVAGGAGQPPLRLAEAENLAPPEAAVAAIDGPASGGERHAADYQSVLEAEGAGPWRRMMQQ